MSWNNSSCASAHGYRISNISNYVGELNLINKSPIDHFYEEVEPFLTKIDQSFIDLYGENISSLMLVGLISAVENYYRNILGEIIKICPISQSHSYEEKVQLGSVLWGPQNLYSKSAFEYIAFSNAKNIKETINKFIKHVVRQHGIWNRLLDDYDRLCELRHCLVHSSHYVSGKNAIKINLNHSKETLRVKIDFANLQEAGMVCTELVQASNNELFELMVDRWAEKWRLLPCWGVDLEKRLKDIYKIFLSKKDYSNNTIQNKLSFNKFKENVITHYNLS